MNQSSRVLLAIVGVVAIAAPMAAQQQRAPGWIEYRYPDGYFTVEAPASWKTRRIERGRETWVSFTPAGEDPSASDHAVLVILIRTPPGLDFARLDLAAATDRIRKALFRQGGEKIEVTGRSAAKLAGGRAHAVRLKGIDRDDKAPFEARVLGTHSTQALLFVACSTAVRDAERYRPLFARMLGSLRYVPARRFSVEPAATWRAFGEPGGAFRVDLPVNWTWLASAPRRGELHYSFMPRATVVHFLKLEATAFVHVRRHPDFARPPLADLANRIRNNLVAANPAVKIGKPAPATAGGLPAIRFTGDGALEGSRSSYRHTWLFVRRGGLFLTVWTYVTHARRPVQGPVLERILASLRVGAPSSPAKPKRP